MSGKTVSRTLKIYIDNKEIDGSVKSIQNRIRELRGEMNKLTVGSEEYNRKAKKIRDLNGILAQHRQQLRATGQEYQTLGSRIGKLADGFNRYMGIVGGAIGALTGLTLTVRKTVDEYAKMEEAEAQVRKYTGMTADQVDRLNESFKKMDTRTSREELNALAGDAGRLGITSQQAIGEFVDGADKIRVALGDDLGENAVRDIGKLAQMFGEDKKKGLRGAMLATGSAVNELAQNSSAGAGAIVEFTARLAGVAQQAGMTQAQIMGIGSVMDQNMQEIPTSATVISQLITKMMQDTGRFAKLAGEDVKSFSELLRTDANAALVKFLQAMKSRGGFQEMAKMFDEMKMDGTRAVGVLSALAGHLDQLAEAQDLANQAYSEGTSVLNEFNVQNSTVQAELDKAKKKFLELSIELGEKLMPIAKYGITAGSVVVKLLSKLINFTSKYAVTITSLAAVIGYLTIARNKDIIVAKIQAFWNEKVMVSFTKLKAALATNPWTAVLLVATAVVGVLIDLARRVDDAAKAQKTLNDIKKKAAEDMVDEEQKIRLLIAAAKDETLAMNERQNAVDQLNKIIPQYNAHLDATTGKYIASKEALDKYLESLKKQYELEGAKDKLRELGKQKADLQIRKSQQEKALEGANAAGSGYTYTTSWGMVGNTASDSRQHIQGQLNDINRGLKSIQAQEDAILGVYGSDMRKSVATSAPPVVQTTTYSGATTGGGGRGGHGGGGGATDEETERLKAVRAAQLAIEQEYVAKRNALMQQYVSDAEMTSEELQVHLENLEMDRLQEELNILNLKESEKNKVMQEMLELRKTWKEREVEQQRALEEQELEDTRSYIEKKAEEMDAALKRMEEQEQERGRLILDVAQQFGSSFGDMMGQFFADGELRFGEFLKNILKLTVDALEKTMVAAIAERTIKDIATLGLVGAAKAAGEIAAITAAFETAKGLIGSFAVGGFTGSGNWDEPKGVVHAGEFVANHHAVGNPSVMPVLSLIDAAQKSGSVGNLNSADIASVLPVSTHLSPLSSKIGDGGGSGVDKQLLSMLSIVAKSNQALLARLKRPIVAETFATGKRSVESAQGLVEKMRRNVARQ